MAEYELYHHGVKGMKWGVRKKKETRQERKIRRTNVRTKRNAMSVLKNEILLANREAKKQDKKLVKIGTNALKYEDKVNAADKKGNLKKRDKYITKWFSELDKTDEHVAKGREAIQKRDYLKRKLSEVESGYLEAGKDYIARSYLTAQGTQLTTELKFITDKGRR